MDNLRKTLGISRSALIANAVIHYKNTIEGSIYQGTRPDDILQEKIDTLQIMLKSLDSEQKQLKHDITKDIDSSPEIKNIPNYDTLKGQVIDLIEKFGEISIPSLSRFLNIEEGLAFVLCSQLKKDGILKFNEKLYWELK